jgi:hypothetical protein
VSVEPVFLISLPRSGSTLLQRLLGAHSRVATAAEPWFLLPPLYALREEGVYSEYGHSTAHRAIAGLCDSLPRGRKDYLEAVSTMARSIYADLSPPGSEVFLDKTPRYGLVVDELMEAFPDATIIALHRNPLAVIASIVSTFDGGSWKPYRHKQDLFLLAERLLAAQQRAPESFVNVRYEELIEDPERTLKRLTDVLGLDWEPEVLTRFNEVPVAGNVGDTAGAEAYADISADPVSKWREVLRSPVRRSWARRYLNWLGSERLALMGYDSTELQADLESIPVGLAGLPGDLGNTMKGVVWSLGEIDSARSKLSRRSGWRHVFTHT